VPTVDRRLAPFVTSALAALLLAGCSDGSSGFTETAGEPEFADGLSAMVGTNGLSANGLSGNGLSANGLSANGLSANGLSANGLATAAFATWFNTNRTAYAAAMKYLVRCALPASKSLAWTNPQTGVAYTWQGGLGVAPGWAAGAKVTTAEQQVVTACLAAHVNQFGASVPLAVEGKTALGVDIPLEANELGTFPYREACFFGNLFTGEGIYGAIDHGNWGQWTSTFRGCVFDYSAIGTTRDCPPIKVAGVCDQLCVKDASQNGYLTCTYGGKTFKALATRIQVSAMSTCGDLRCDPAEHCGTGSAWNNCKGDCGTCR